ncbi:class II aldolase/adducin [Tieghemostelium lacteum]|uniref:Probable methylthioribulose-1-phosphate dehydratase n=1 Tax=Tieghemostelium lacteum TaxID=361077 RepID=A0A151ZS42_TIELA|nr:class II aldolase/adducin [Tieghemostelium lacteum]|eukprot:KYQ96739.1 class II aldolase/adducin [Tieghemostelium lacteum]
MAANGVNNIATTTSGTNAGGSVENDPLVLIPELSRLFYKNGWVTGTAGGISMRYQNQIYITPSSVQKERIKSTDLFIYNDNEEITYSPPLLKPSQCSPLFFLSHRFRNAGCCIHTHSQNAVLITLKYDKEFIVIDQEMIKGIIKGYDQPPQYYKNFEKLVIPIIDNHPEELDLKQPLYEAMEKYPETNAILVRRHGLFVWGPNWAKTKTMTECFDYLFEISLKMLALGIDPSIPVSNNSNK